MFDVWFYKQKKDEANATCICLHKETVTIIMMLCKNSKAMVNSPDGDNNFFDVVAEVLQWDILIPYMLIYRVSQKCIRIKNNCKRSA